MFPAAFPIITVANLPESLPVSAGGRAGVRHARVSDPAGNEIVIVAR